MNGDLRANDAFYQRDGVATGRGFSAPAPLTPSQQGIPLKKQSGLGITSFVAGIVAWLAYFCAIGAVMIGAASDQSGNKVLDKIMMVTFFATIIGGLLVAVFGLALGVANLFQTERKKLFGILGTIMNGLVVLGVLGCFVLGLMAAALVKR